MSRFAGRVVKRYGETDHAYQIFMEEAAKCDPPLMDEELQLIWGSASKLAARYRAKKDMLRRRTTTMILLMNP